MTAFQIRIFEPAATSLSIESKQLSVYIYNLNHEYVENTSIVYVLYNVPLS